MNIAHWVTGWANHAPDRTAICFRDDRYNYREFEQRIRATASVLHKLGIKKTDRVALLDYNRPQYLAIIFACARLGATVVPLNWRLTRREHLVQIKDCLPDILIVGPEFIEHADSLRDSCTIEHWLSLDVTRDNWVCFDSWVDNELDADPPDDGDMESALLLVYTSGTTGKPKGAVLTQNAVFWNALNSQAAHELTSEDRILTDLPLFHVGGLNIQTLPAFHTGASVILHHRFKPENTLHDIASLKPTINLMVPATMQALINHPHWDTTDLSSLRLCMTGSSVIPEHLLLAFMDRDIPTGQIYGATETCPVAICLGAEFARDKVGSCGKPALYCEARIIRDDGSEAAAGEAGEIHIRGQNLFSGYWNDEESTTAAMAGDWFKTGDVGHTDRDGFYYIDDRTRDVIISGGENIYPAEIENLITALPGVYECAVIGKPDSRWGEVPVAFIVAESPGRIDVDSLASKLEGQLAHFKMPKEVILVDELPRNVMGKILKYQLRETYQEQ